MRLRPTDFFCLKEKATEKWKGMNRTTPFGRCAGGACANRKPRSLSQGPLARRCRNGRCFATVREARGALGISERSLTALEALLSFHPETTLSGDGRSYFRPTTPSCCERRGRSGSTLRRHMAALIEAGLVIRRDSPNGKRYARRAGGGEIDTAFGFDLSPLVARADEIAAAAEAASGERRLVDAARERASVCLATHCETPQRSLLRRLIAAEGAPAAAASSLRVLS